MMLTTPSHATMIMMSMAKTTILACLLLLPALALAQCQRCPVYPPPPGIPASSGQYPAPAPAALSASDWIVLTVGPWAAPWNQENGSLRATFLPVESGSLNYLYTASPYTVAGHHFLRATFGVVTTGGDPYLFAPTDCGGPARVRLLLYSLNYLGTEFERWWNRDAEMALYPSTNPAVVGTLTADLTQPDRWYSIFGKTGVDAPAPFAAALAGARVGVTFGGPCFAGHGVAAVNGGVDFVLQWLWVE